MSNTRTLAIVVVLTAATLVVGLTVAATMTTSAFAGGSKRYGQDKYMKGTRDDGNDGGSGNQNGNTITALKCKNKGSASGFDTTVNQECENLICTHPGNNATCVSEQEQAVVTPPVTPPVTACPDFDITMDETAVIDSTTLHTGDVVCIEGLGSHPGFVLGTTNTFRILVTQPDATGCPETSNHPFNARLTSPQGATLGNVDFNGLICVGQGEA